MSALSAWAGQVAEAAARVNGEAAITVAREQARDFLAVERLVTPKKTGHLAGSEAIDSVGGGGTHAVAVVSPHAVYAEFRENGGTIHAHERWVMTPRGRRRHTLHFDGVFALHVTQAGAHYVEKAEGASRGMMTGIAETVMAEMLAGI